MKIYKDAPFYIFMTLFSLLFISYSESIYYKLRSLEIVNIYIVSSSNIVISLYIIPIIIITTIYYYFICVYKSKKTDIIFIVIIFLFKMTLSDLKDVLFSNQIIIFYFISDVFFILLISKYFRGASKSTESTEEEVSIANLVNNDIEIMKLTDNKRECFEHLLDSFMPILETHSKNSLSISISGEWGSGKSSFLNLIKEKVRAGKNNYGYEILEFYPWRCDSPENITKTFFTLLADLVSTEDRSLKRSIQQYITLLIPEQNYFTKLIHSFSKNLNQNKLHDEIDNDLIKYPKKIIVFIDDMDRLEKDELLAVLKIIRNSGRFKNILFISALDKNQICKILGRNKEYLDKFFQHDRSIPPFDNMERAMIFKDLFDLNINKQIIREIDFKLDDISVSVIDMLLNIRDMKIYISRLNIALSQQKNISDLSSKIVTNKSNYEFKYLDQLKMSNGKLAITSLVMIKFPQLIRSDENYLKELHFLLLNPEAAKKYYIKNKVLGEISQDEYSNVLKDSVIKEFPEFEVINSNGNIKFLFAELFRENMTNEINFDKSFLLYFDNYSLHSISQLNILRFEFSCVIGEMDDFTESELKEIISNPVFNLMRTELFQIMYSHLLKEDSPLVKLKILKLINYLLELESNEVGDLTWGFYKEIKYGLLNLVEAYFQNITVVRIGAEELIEFILDDKIHTLLQLDLPVKLFERINKNKDQITPQLLKLFDLFVKNYYLNYDFIKSYLNLNDFSPAMIIKEASDKDVLLNVFSNIFIDENYGLRIKFVKSFIMAQKKVLIIDASGILIHLFSTQSEKLKNLYTEGTTYFDLLGLYPFDENDIRNYIFVILSKKDDCKIEELLEKANSYFPSFFSADFKKFKLDTILEDMSNPDHPMIAPISKNSQGRWEIG